MMGRLARRCLYVLLAIGALSVADAYAQVRPVELTEASPEVASARRHIEQRLGPGPCAASLEFVTGFKQTVTIPPNYRIELEWQSRVECTFRFLPDGDDVIPVQVMVRSTDHGPWEGGPPECGAYPELCRVRVGRAAALATASACGVSVDGGQGTIELGRRREDGPGLYWQIRSAQRLVVVDASTGDWYETEALPYIR